MDEEKSKKIKVVAISLVIGLGIGFGIEYFHLKNKVEFSEKYAILSECEEILRENNIEIKQDDESIGFLINGYLDALNDKYTFYKNVSDDEEYVASVNALSCLLTCGYSIALDDNGYLIVDNVKKDSVAEEQGLMTGDIILEIDGKNVKKAGITNIADKLSGKDGTTMQLLLERNNEQIEINFKRKNDYNVSESLVEAKILDNDIAYVKISHFTLDIDALYGGAISKLKDDYNSIIIDLRNNSGGNLETTVDLADRFIGDGEVCKYKKNGNNEKLNTHTNGKEINIPIVVLGNEKTASSSEVLLSLLKQYGKDVTFVGTNTFGKGIFQEEEELSNGGVLRYTAGYYTVGDWECYDGIGIEPDIEVKMDSNMIGTDDDIQLKKAIEVLSESNLN